MRLEIDFIPHIGIGNSDDAYISKKRVDELNKREISIIGKVDCIDVIEFRDGVVAAVEKINL